MTIKTKTELWIGAYFLVFSMFALRVFLAAPTEWWWPLGMEVIVIALSAGLYLYRKQREVRFQSNDNGITIVGSKEGLRDPDFLPYSSIRGVEIERATVRITTASGRIVRLQGLRRHARSVVEEIRSRIAQQDRKGPPVSNGI